MSNSLTATGAFKRMDGLWLPENDRSMYEKSDEVFRKPGPSGFASRVTVGGWVPGSAPTESARVFFWSGKRCPLCDMNYASIALGLGLANTGQVVLTASPHDDFSDGYFVAVKGVATQLTIPPVTQNVRDPLGVAYGFFLDPGYSGARGLTIKDTDEPIAEDDSYITSQWPSACIAFRPSIYYETGLGGNYSSYRYGASDFWQSNYNERSGFYWSDVPRVLTFMRYVVTCGTVSGGTRTTSATQALWTGISQSDYDPEEMWLGIGEGFVKTGLGRYVFMPDITVSTTTQDRWKQSGTYWKVDAIAGTLVDVQYREVIATGSGVIGTTIQQQRSSGLYAIRANGIVYRGTEVTESPKSRSMRSSLVTSPQGLIWKDGVLPGKNEEHTQKGIKTPETAWPFKQPGGHAVSLSIGAAKSRPSSLTASFVTKSTMSTTAPEELAPYISAEKLDRPIVRINRNFIEDEQGDIGRSYPYNTYPQTTTEYKDVPKRAEWQGVFDSDLAVMAATPADEPLTGREAGYAYPSGDNESHRWSTYKTDSYSFTIENLNPTTNSKAFWEGDYSATNVMPADSETPDDTPSTGDLFYAAPDRSGDVQEAVPTLEMPQFAATSTLRGVRLHDSPDSRLFSFYYYPNQVMPINRYADGIPLLVPKTESFGSIRYVSMAFVSGYTVLDAGTHYFKREITERGSVGRYGIDACGWRSISSKTSSTPTTITTSVTKERNQYVVQLATPEAAVAEGWAKPAAISIGDPGSEFTGYPEPRSEFYKADYSQHDDLMSRLCSVAQVSVIKSCKWVPKETQLFVSLRRDGTLTNSSAIETRGLPGGWGYYGGQLAADDKLEMLDKYRSTGRNTSEPCGGVVQFVLRRTWQIVLEVATGNPTFSGSEVISDSLTKTNNWLTGTYGGILAAITTFNGTRKIKFDVTFDLDDATVETHTLNHEQVSQCPIALSEQEFIDLEDGQQIEKDLPAFVGGDVTRQWGFLDGLYIDENLNARTAESHQVTTVKIKLT